MDIETVLKLDEDERFVWSEMTHAIEDQLAAADLKTCDKPAEQ